MKDLIVSFAKDETIPTLLRPLAIDVFLSEYALNAWSQAVVPRRDCLIGYVCETEQYIVQIILTLYTRKKDPS